MSNKLNHQSSYKIGAKFKHVSSGALVPGAVFTIGVCVDPETQFIEGTERKKENEVYGIGLLNPQGLNYSHIIHKGNYEDITEITKDEFAKITANTHSGFEYIGE